MIEESLFWDFFYMTILALEYFFIKVIFDGESKKKLCDSKIYFNFFISLGIGITFIIFKIPISIKLFFNILILIIFYKISYNEKLSKGIFIVLMYMMMQIGAEALSISIVMKINNMSEGIILLQNSKFRLEGVLLSKSLLFLFLIIYKYRNLRLNISKKETVYISIPVIANIFSILLVCNYILELDKENFIANPYIILMPAFLFASNLSIVFILSKIIKDREIINESKSIKEKMDMQYIYYKSLQENNAKIRQLYHDMKNHIMCIEGMCNNSSASNYIKSINEELNEYKNSFNTGSMILDIILSEKEALCKEKNIEFIADVNFEMCNFVDMMDTCSIFSNIIDNAIEACENINNLKITKKISIRGTYLNDFFILKAENSKENNIIKKDNKILTNKKNSFYHGIGICNIQRIVKKYEGQTDIQYTQHSFTLKLMIPIKKSYK